MPLSRLSARSHRKGLTARGKTSKRNKAAASVPRSRHLGLWEAIRLTREELDSWKLLSSYIEQLFRDIILPREKRITEALSRLTDVLIQHLINPQRNAAERSLLGLWIIQNLETLNSHPFADELHRRDLSLRFTQILNDKDPIDSQLIRLVQRQGTEIDNEADSGNEMDSREHTFSQQSDIDLEEDVVFDFGWHTKEPTVSEDHQSSRDQHSEDTEENSSTREDRTDDAFDNIDPALLSEHIKRSQNKLSIDRLFRQLAKVLHPDRELDEEIKAEKHLLMSECLEARQNNDIDKLLQLYCEHVGELPEGLTDKSHQELIIALELQLKLLQRELRQHRFGDALLSQIVDRYSDASNDRINAKVALHAKELDQEIRLNEKVIEHLGSNTGLQQELNKRRSIEMDRMTINEFTGNY